MSASPAGVGKQFSEANRERLTALCADLVAARSEQPTGDTTAPAAVVSGFLAERGLKPDVVAARATKPNIVCTIEGERPGPHLVFNGHLDTLNPGDEAGWSVPVWTMGRQAGRLSGLGIGNMKAGSAALAMAFAVLSGMRHELAGRITLTLVGDEVVFGPDGAGFLIERDPSLLGDFVINGEGPGGLNLAVAEKGLLWLAVEARAAPGQGMLTARGSSATARLAHLLAEMDGWNDEYSTPPADLADVTRSGLRLSVNAGTIVGGNFVSQVAPLVRAEVDFRVPPGMNIAAIEERVRQSAEAIGGIEVDRIKGWDPNWTAADNPLCQVVADVASEVRGRRTERVVRLPSSDASRWRARGVPAICYGPQAELASGVDDYVYEDDVVDCVAVYVAAALALCRNSPSTNRQEGQ